MRFENVLFWIEFVVKASLQEVIASLPSRNKSPYFFKEYAPSALIADEMLWAFYQKLVDTEIEQESWQVLIYGYSRPLPDALARQLIIRHIAIVDLAHSNQSELVLRELIQHDEAALLRLGKQYYTSPDYILQDLEKLLVDFGDHYPLLRQLLYVKPSEEAKRKLLLTYVSKHEQADDLSRQVWVLESEAKAKQATDTKEIKTLLASNEPRVWRALAENAYTPTDVLEVLASTSGATYAREIRHYAKMNLSKRKRSG